MQNKLFVVIVCCSDYVHACRPWWHSCALSLMTCLCYRCCFLCHFHVWLMLSVCVLAIADFVYVRVYCACCVSCLACPVCVLLYRFLVGVHCCVRSAAPRTLLLVRVWRRLSFACPCVACLSVVLLICHLLHVFVCCACLRVCICVLVYVCSICVLGAAPAF